MGQKLASIMVPLAVCMAGTGVALAGSSTAFFGVGLTVETSKPPTAPGTISRNATYTPGAVAIGLAAQGYTQVALVVRTPDTYVFSAIQARTGQAYTLTVATWGGQIISAVAS